MGGTSAGAGLTMSAIHKLKDQGVKLPKALFLGTPPADFTKTGDSHYLNEGVDRLLGTWDGLITEALALYANGENLSDPLISPLYGDLSNFPPSILVSGTRDLLLSPTVATHRKLRDAGGITDLIVIEGHSHGDYMVAFDTPESISVFNDTDNFFTQYLR